MQPAQQDEGDDEAFESAIRLGATREEAEAALRIHDGDDATDGGGTDDGKCDVFPENWPAVMLFLKLQTQWQCGPMGGLIGLMYPGVEVVMRRSGIRDKETMFRQIQTMEFAAVGDGDGDADF